MPLTEAEGKTVISDASFDVLVTMISKYCSELG